VAPELRLGCELGRDLYDMRKSLAEKGLKYVDGPLE
jgi:hypothetical protein